MKRPYPPEELIDRDWCEEFLFEPAKDIHDWLQETILNPSSKLYNKDHEHLVGHSGIGFLWAECAFEKQGRPVLGQAEIVQIQASGWKKYRQEAQMIRWFGFLPKALITLDANYCSSCPDADFMALVEHELYHLKQKISPNGGPCYDSQTGHAVLQMRGHDIEEFFGVVKRWGANDSVKRLVEIAKNAPFVSDFNVSACCGNCVIN